MDLRVMTEKDKERFLIMIRTRHGEKIGTQCAQYLEKNPQVTSESAWTQLNTFIEEDRRNNPPPKPIRFNS